MTETTALDRTHAAMAAAPGYDAARLRFYAALADAELFLLIEEAEDGAEVRPRVFALEEGRFVLAFDREDRLAAFAEGPAPYAALPGRVLAQRLAGSGIGLGLNLAVAPSEFLMPPEAVDWLAATLGAGPDETAARPVAFTAPRGLPEALLSALDAKLALMAGLAERALLAGVTYEDGRRGHLLALVGARAGSEPALAKAVAEALTFCGIEAGELDVTFLPTGAPATGAMERAALAFDIPAPASRTAQIVTPAAPGTDPSRPPKLR
ncbi:MAG: SseB family protein [Rhodobacteraceae bacterium]|nr:SseB family protein [Paracoccaceae bacterium]